MEYEVLPSIIQKLQQVWITTTTATMVQRTMTTLGTDRRLCEARTAIRWQKGMTSADIELYSSRFYVGIETFYLQLRYSRKNGCTQRSMSDIQASATRAPTTTTYREKTFPPPVEVKAINAIIKQATLEFDLWSTHHVSRPLTTLRKHTNDGDFEEERQARRSRLDLQQPSLKIQDPTDMGTERDGPSFYFSHATFYSQKGYSRVDNNFEESMHRLTVIQVRRLRYASRNRFKVTQWTCTQDLA
ncbi:hypothetical protein F5J12DRAFT_532735 [Pisolithus orientalis]|uniref:uncharacterized protein n=1 Tax=Pisolithus orientalis TaxID=936130 RepID=UPI002224CD4B|nr:uncharacterized protein F5J12DRAFT_532735 [Pisolithus orientalis]KAI5987951.1 hypothetical protein F5J12DRAFT_532735 [Pisolithus orientalis]